MKIAIIRNAGSAISNRVLAGVYGTMVAEEGAAKGQFTAAPEFTRISHLFRMIEGGQVDLEVSGVEVIEVPDAMGNDVKAQLMHQLGARWQTMYASMPVQADTLTKAMLSAEAAQVASGVTSHMAAMGNRLYKVSASVEAQTVFRSNEYSSEKTMLLGMQPVEGATFTLLDVEPANHAAGTAVPEAQPEAEDVNTQQEATGEQTQIHFEGHKAAGLVTYEILVAASSREGAAAMIQYILNENSLRNAYIAQNLTVTPVKLENVRQGDALTYSDVDDFDGSERHGY